MKQNILFYTIFYILLTSFFIFLFIYEKKINKKISEQLNKFSNLIILFFKIKNDLIKKIIKKIIYLVESFGTAIIIVLVIQRFYIGNFLVPTGSMEPTIMPKDRLFGNMVSYKFRKPFREEIIVFKEPLENKVLYTKRLMGMPGEKIKIENGSLIVNDIKISKRYYSSLGEIGLDEWVIPKKGDLLKIVPGMNYKSEYSKRNINIAEIQKYLLKNSDEIKRALPNLEFYINGHKTGMILDFIHNEKILNKLINGEVFETELEEDYYLALGDNTNGSYDSRMWGFVKESRIRGKAIIRFWPLNRIKILK